MPEIKVQGSVPGNPDTLATAKLTARRLLEYCQANDWAGFDPYDALNSRLFQALPFRHFKLPRLVLTQALKRSPVNLRPLLLMPKTHNAKGLALFLTSLVKLSKVGLVEKEELIGDLAERVLALRSGNTPHWCWGYNFDWQTRFMLVPRGSPNIICTTFVANALLDVFQESRAPQLLNAAVSAAEFMLEVLFWRERGSVACFSYTPLWRSEVHNANLLGAALLCRVARESGERRFLEPALDAVRYSVGKQHADGSWDYGEAPTQRWIDNFHTGFNLCALRDVGRYTQSAEFEASILRGFEFFRNHFFREDGAPKYFHNGTYPIDIHSVAQSIITLLELRDLTGDNTPLVESVMSWAMANMWDARGYFYFQQHRHYTVRIPFIRWSQAWMLTALATLLEAMAPIAPTQKTANRVGEEALR